MCLKIIIVSVFIALNFVSESKTEKFRVCVVDGRGGFKRAGKYCPILDSHDSKVECVVGVDRLDCLRRISKGKVDFSVFTPEDLVTATNSEVEVLITDQMKFTKDENEYEIVAIVNDASGIKSQHDLRDKKYCHPGYGYEVDWTNILANYLEASVIPQSCMPSLTLTENRIKASSAFFKSACKAGPWVNDPFQDHELKKKYPNLCQLCDIPSKCNTNDKYWGRRGPLYCLTDNVGDVSWVRLDDVKIHFGLTPGAAVASPEGYSYMCQDGSMMPVANATAPCVWAVKPWPVIAAKRKTAQELQSFISTVNISNSNWEPALINLIQTFKQEIKPLAPIEPIESYLYRAKGYLSANSFTGCHPPRTIRICTTSNIENAKCGWMREAAAVYGVEPDLDCLKAENVTHCMDAIQYGAADVVITPPDLVNIGKKKYNLKTLFYETVNDEDKYITVAIMKSTSSFKTLEDLRGARACFPNYDGIAWNSALHALRSRNLLDSCPHEQGMADYFGESCVPGLPQYMPDTLKANCHDRLFEGEYGAIRCLQKGYGDVAFISRNSLDEIVKDPREFTSNLRKEDFKILCHNPSAPCHLSWAPVGQAMIAANKSETWIKDTLDVFMQLDNLFGKNYKTVTTPFTLFGLFDSRTNILFHDATMKIRNVPTVSGKDKMIRQYDNILSSINVCIQNAAYVQRSTISLILFTSLLVLLLPKY